MNRESSVRVGREARRDESVPTARVTRRLAAAITVVAFAATVLSLAGASQLALLSSLVFAAVLVPAESGPVARGLLATAGVAALYLCIGAVLDVLAIRVEPPYLAISGVLLLGLLAVFAGDWRFGRGRRGERVLALTLALLVLAVIPQMLGTATDIVARLAPGYDNTNHFRLLMASVEARGFFWSQAVVPGLFSESMRYSQGEAFLSGYTSWLVRGGTAPPSAPELVHLAGALYPLKLVATALVCVALTRDMLWDRLSDGSAARGMLLSGTAVVLLTAGGIVTVTTLLGFQTQALANWAVMCGLLALVQRDRGMSTSAALVLASGCMAIAAHSWPFTLPVLALPVADLVFREIRRIRVWAWCAMLALAFVAFLGYAGLDTGVKSGALLTNASSGTVYRLPLLAWLSLGALTVLGLAFLRRPGMRSSSLRVWGWAALGAAGTSAVIAAIQWQGTGPSYYFYKSGYLLVLLASVAAGSAVGIIAGGLVERRGPLLPTAVCGAVLLSWIPTAPLTYLYFALKEPTRVSRLAIAEALGEAKQEGRVRDIVVMHPCRGRDVDYSSRWTGTLLKSWTPSRDVFVSREEQVAPSPTPGQRVDLLRSYARTREGLAVYIAQPCPLTLLVAQATIPGVDVRPDVP